MKSRRRGKRWVCRLVSICRFKLSPLRCLSNPICWLSWTDVIAYKRNSVPVSNGRFPIFDVRWKIGAFVTTGYSDGHLELGPGEEKEAQEKQSKGELRATIVSGSDSRKFFEVSYVDDKKNWQCFLLGVHDSFRVPIGNVFYLKNHSNTTKCVLLCSLLHLGRNESTT